MRSRVRVLNPIRAEGTIIYCLPSWILVSNVFLDKSFRLNFCEVY